MSLAGALFFLISLAICSLLVLAPLRSRRGGDRSDSSGPQERERLLQRYETALAALRELDEDRLTGKIDADSHALEREALLQQGEALLAALDALEGEGRG
ncbi:MAG: hypothetical protein OXF44_11665 [Anaerolineaceae bacterium]|nr:hypothetical protein [Anaerolineaceae bacterium]MCY4022176.1 hypothetical protein [Anaerolineaceae bacterium]